MNFSGLSSDFNITSEESSDLLLFIFCVVGDNALQLSCRQPVCELLIQHWCQCDIPYHYQYSEQRRLFLLCVSIANKSHMYKAEQRYQLMFAASRLVVAIPTPDSPPGGVAACRSEILLYLNAGLSDEVVPSCTAATNRIIELPKNHSTEIHTEI